MEYGLKTIMSQDVRFIPMSSCSSPNFYKISIWFSPKLISFEVNHWVVMLLFVFPNAKFLYIFWSFFFLSLTLVLSLTHSVFDSDSGLDRKPISSLHFCTLGSLALWLAFLGSRPHTLLGVLCIVWSTEMLPSFGTWPCLLRFTLIFYFLLWLL